MRTEYGRWNSTIHLDYLGLQGLSITLKDLSPGLLSPSVDLFPDLMDHVHSYWEIAHPQNHTHLSFLPRIPLFRAFLYLYFHPMLAFFLAFRDLFQWRVGSYLCLLELRHHAFTWYAYKEQDRIDISFCNRKWNSFQTDHF